MKFFKRKKNTIMSGVKHLKELAKCYPNPRDEEIIDFWKYVESYSQLEQEKYFYLSELGSKKDKDFVPYLTKIMDSQDNIENNNNPRGQQKNGK